MVCDLVLGLHVNWVLLYSISGGHIVGKRWWLVIERSRLNKGLKCSDDTCLFHQRYVSKESVSTIHTSWTTTNSLRFFNPLLLNYNLTTCKGFPLFPATFYASNSNRFTTLPHRCTAHPNFCTRFLLFNVCASINLK